MEGTYLSIIKAIYDKPPVNLQWQTMESISFKIRNRTRVPPSHHYYSTYLEVLATAIRQEKEIKGIQTGKEEVKLSLFADYMILYIENPKDTTRKLL